MILYRDAPTIKLPSSDDGCHSITSILGFPLLITNRSIMTTGKAFLAVLAGVAAGTALGMILAPKRSDSRKKFLKVGGDLGQALNDKIDERFDELVKTIAIRIKQSKPVNGSPEKVEQGYSSLS